MKPQLALLMLLCIANWAVAEPNEPGHVKGKASPDGLQEAKRDVAAFKTTLPKKSPAQLIDALIPAGDTGYGGYEYYYNFMANRAIREELASRGKLAEAALRANTFNKTHLWQAINGPMDYTVGRVCKELLAAISE